MLDLRRLSIFVAVAEEGSFTAAAQRLYLTQSAVSQQISILERETGTPLFRRLTRGVEVTAAGSILADRARTLLGEALAIEHEMSRLASDGQELRLGAFVSAGIDMLPQTFRVFAERCPDVRLILKATSGEPIAMLRDAEIDVLLMWDYDFAPLPDDPKYVRMHIAVDPMMVVLPVDHPMAGRGSIAVTELADEKWITRAHRPLYGTEPYQKMFQAAGILPEVQLSAVDYQSLQGMVAAGMGVSLAPRMSLVPHRHDVVVRPTVAPVFARRVSAWAIPEIAAWPTVTELIGVLRHVAAEMTADDSPSS